MTVKRLNLALIIIWCAVGALVAAAMVGGLISNREIGRGAFSFGIRGKADSKLLVDENISVENIDTLKLSFASDTCRVFLTDGDNINVKHYGRGIPKERYVKVFQNGGEAEVTTRTGPGISISFSMINEYSLIEIYLPKSYKNALDVKLSSGTLDFDGAPDLKKLNIELASGSIRSESEIKAQSAAISASSGVIKLKGGLITGDYTIKLTSGTIEVGTRLTGSGTANVSSGTLKLSGVDITESLQAGVTSGTINIELSGDPSLKFTGKKTSGSLKTYFETYSDSKDRVFAVVGDGPYKELTIKTSSGTARVTSSGGTMKTSKNPIDFNFDNF